MIPFMSSDHAIRWLTHTWGWKGAAPYSIWVKIFWDLRSEVPGCTKAPEKAAAQPSRTDCRNTDKKGTRWNTFNMVLHVRDKSRWNSKGSPSAENPFRFDPFSCWTRSLNHPVPMHCAFPTGLSFTGCLRVAGVISEKHQPTKPRYGEW